MLGLVGLQDRPATTLAPARATHGLAEQLVRPLGGALVGQVEGDVGRHDPDEHDGRDVQALGDEARPDEDVRAAGAERVDDPGRGAAPLGDVAVQAIDAQARVGRPDLALDALRAATQVADARRGAARAARGQRRRPTAVVAAQGRAGLVVDERSLAVGAGLDVAAIPAQHDRRGAAPVEDEDGLLAGGHVERGERRIERSRDRAAMAVGELGAQVDDLDERRLADRPRGQDDPRVRPVERPAVALDRRRRRPEDDRRTGQPPELEGRVPSLESRRPVALVRGVVLLVDDDDPEVGERRPDGQPRPDDDVDVAGPDAPPLVGALAIGQPGMDERDPRVEVRPQPVDQGQREGDLGHEDEGRATRLQRRRDGLDVDGRLAAAGHPVEEQRPRVARRDRGDARHRRPAAGARSACSPRVGRRDVPRAWPRAVDAVARGPRSRAGRAARGRRRPPSRGAARARPTASRRHPRRRSRPRPAGRPGAVRGDDRPAAPRPRAR